MKKIYYLLPLLSSLPALLSCNAFLNSPPVSKTRVEPVLQVHSADKSAQGYYQLGRYYMGQNRLELAAEAYRKAIELSASFVDAHNALGVVYSEQGKFDEAISELTAALKIVPDVARVYNNLGYTYYLQNNFAGAVLAYEKAIALEPRNQRAYNNLGIAYDKLGDTEKSRLAFRQAEELNAPVAVAGDTQASPTGMPGPVMLPVASLAANIAIPSAAPVSVDLSQAYPAIAVASPSTTYQLPTTRESIALYPEPGTALTPVDPGASPRSLMSVSPSVVAADAGSSVGSENLPSIVFQTERPWALSTAGVSMTSTSFPASIKTEPGKPFRLEIANGNGITGLARKVRKTLVAQGLPVARLTNIKPYQERQTVIQYRAAFEEQALSLSKRLRKTPKLVVNEYLRSNADLRLVLGRDVGTQVALFSPDKEETISLAYNELKP